MRALASRRVVVLSLAVMCSACGLFVSFDYDTSNADNPGQRFSLTGTVSGVGTGATAAISVNGTPGVQTPDGPFTIANALVDGSDFVVSATAPNESCTVSPAGGRVDGADVSVTVECVTSDSKLATLIVDQTSLEPAFDPKTSSYAGHLPWFADQTFVVATTTSPDGTFFVDDAGPFNSGASSAPFSFANTEAVGISGIAPDGTRGSKVSIALRRSEYLKASNTPLAGGANFGQTVAVSQDGATVVIGAPFEDGLSAGVNGDAPGSSFRAGAVYVFVREGTTFRQEAYIKATNTRPVPDDAGGATAGIWPTFGSSVALSANGDLLAIGAPGETSAATGVNGDQSDTSAIYGRGAVYLYRRTSGTWSPDAYLKSSDAYVPGVGTQFGASVAVSGDGSHVAVAAPKPSTGSGTVTPYVYLFTSAPAWAQEARIQGPSDPLGFAASVALDSTGSTLAVGANIVPRSFTISTANISVIMCGLVEVYSRAGSIWSLSTNLVAPPAPGFTDAAALDQKVFQLMLGTSVAISAGGDRIVAGGPGFGTAPGAAAVFVKNGPAWSLESLLQSPSRAADERFGASAAISTGGDLVVVGAPGEQSLLAGVFVTPPAASTTAQDVGAAFVFARGGGGGWAPRAFIKASNPTTNAYFGAGVGIAGDGGLLVSGAPGDPSAATGLNGDQNDTSLHAAGASYAY